MKAYSELYLEDAQENLGCMFDYAVNSQGMSLAEFFGMFVNSVLSTQFQRGNPWAVCGHSGVELAWIVEEEHSALNRVEPRLSDSSRSAEYWAGWALAYYQWDSGLTFAQIAEAAPVEDVLAMYCPYHEMDLRHFCNRIDELVAAAYRQTQLQRRRLSVGFSQSQLAKASGVSVRTIQHYEQRQKDIGKAGYDQLLRLSQALYCSPADLMEPLDAQRYAYAVERF